MFNYWTIILRLLKIGLPWDVIEELGEMDIAVLLGVDTAINEKQQQNQARSMR